MQIRMIPVLASAFLSAALLFGGWFAYQSFAMVHPLRETAESIKGVKSASVDVGADRVTVTLDLEKDADLLDICGKIAERATSAVGGKKLVVRIRDRASEKLDKLWSGMLFDIAEAMETRRYGEIPETLHRLERSVPGIRAEAAMDETNVYIRISDGSSSKFVILPRQPERVGVWPNEQGDRA